MNWQPVNEAHRPDTDSMGMPSRCPVSRDQVDGTVTSEAISSIYYDRHPIDLRANACQQHQQQQPQQPQLPIQQQQQQEGQQDKRDQAPGPSQQSGYESSEEYDFNNAFQRMVKGAEAIKGEPYTYSVR